ERLCAVERCGVLSSGRLLEARQRATAQDPEAPRVGPVVVGRPARKLEQFVEGLALDGLGAEGLVGATGADRLFEIHRLRIALQDRSARPRRHHACFVRGERSCREPPLGRLELVPSTSVSGVSRRARTDAKAIAVLPPATWWWLGCARGLRWSVVDRLKLEVGVEALGAEFTTDAARLD